MARAVSTIIDSINFFVETADLSASVLTVTASATGTYNGADQTITVHKGGMVYINFTTIAATCTVRMTAFAKDPISGNYGIIGNISLDGLTTGNVACASWQIYPGIQTTVGTTNLEFHHNGIFGRIIKFQASITATASGGGAAVSFTTGLTKVV